MFPAARCRVWEVTLSVRCISRQRLSGKRLITVFSVER